jgi:replicative DNA helicase
MSIMVKTPLQYLIIDHGKLMKHNMLAGNKRSDEEIGATCNALKEIAKDLNIFVILLWQLKRPTGDVVRIPSLSDLRGSGEIEESADIVMFLHRDEYYGIEGAVNGKTDVVIAKNRNGDTGVVECTFVPNYSRFEDLHDENDWMGVSKDVVENKIEKNTSNILF